MNQRSNGFRRPEKYLMHVDLCFRYRGDEITLDTNMRIATSGASDHLMNYCLCVCVWYAGDSLRRILACSSVRVVIYEQQQLLSR